MTKLAIILVLGTITINSCGPSPEEIEAKRITDSVITSDSLAMIQTQQQRIADSIKQAQETQKSVAE